MRKIAKGFFLAGIIVLTVMGTTKCKKDALEDSWNGEVTIIMINQSDQDTHIFTADEFFDASNKIPPGKRREVKIQLQRTANSTDSQNEYEEKQLTIFAGRNGTVIITKTFVLNFNNRKIYVRFDNDDLFT
ncbi:hypothetical protein MNBD_BACTEROID01-2411 [hydrothermal vent metagenome]|uniref:Uncharacterized protein n=1 Tax=hydrothermal vent metagenome TaxID=652676 RepID=A0A3B0U649_9ZZZZ